MAKRKGFGKFKVIGIIVIVLIVEVWMKLMSHNAGLMRSVKSFKSNWTGGLNRTVTIYSQDGKKLGSWSGKFDVSNSEKETWFYLDGKRVILQGGIVINEEND